MISFFVLDILSFLYYANEKKKDLVIGGSTNTVQHSIQNITRNIRAVFFKLGIRNVHHKRNNNTYHVVAMATLLAPVPFYEKPNIPICNL